MALDQNAQYPVGTIGPNANYPEGEAVNSSAPGALDGYPWEKEGVNDLLGFQQALLRAGGVAASGNPDTAVLSQYLQMLVEIASGRAINYDESGIADAYVLDLQANQQGPANLFIGLEARFIPGNTNTGASTANVAGLGVKNIKTKDGNDPQAGDLLATEFAKLRYDGVSWILELTGDQIFIDTIQSRAANTTPVLEDNAGREMGQPSKVWVNFNGTGVVAIRDSFNVSSITDNGVGNYAVNHANALANVNYSLVGCCGGGSASGVGFVTIRPANPAAASHSIFTVDATGTNTDYNFVTTAVFAND